VREGAELARRSDAGARELALLERGVQLAQAIEDAHERSLATWVFVALADALDRAGQTAAAITRLQEGLPLAQGEAAEVLARRLANLAAGEGGNLEAAAEAYERLLEASPGDPSLWEPLLDVYSRIGDRARFEGFIEHCLDAVLGIRDRVTLRLAHARFLAEVVNDERAATEPLRAVLDDEPGHAEATPLLVDIYTRHEMVDELAALLTEQFDRARDQQDGPGAARLALELGKLYEQTQRGDAIDVYRQALEHAPDDAALLRTLIDRLGEDADPSERAELTHRLLASASAEEAEALALELAQQWNALEQPDRALDALALGQRAAPNSTTLRDRLEAHYASHQMWRPLAELLERVADAASGPEALARFKNAATLYRDELGDLEAAANALRRAIELAPEDLSLFGELARNLAAAGRHAEAIDDVTALLDKHPEADRGRCNLLRVRAELELAIEKLDEAVRDLEEAWAIDATDVASAYADALERLKAFAFTQNDPETERAAVMKLLAVHDKRGDTDQARQVLVEWMEQTPNDVEALRSLRDRVQAAERWKDLARACEQLIELEEGEARGQAALQLAEACARAGTPEAARAGLERVHETDPGNAEVRAALRQLYQTIGARAELAKILVDEADAIEDVDERVVLLHRATELYLQEAQPEAALQLLQLARKLRSDDKHTELLLIDVNVQLGKLDDADKVLDEGIAAHKRRRSPELASLQQRKARVCAARGDVEEQLHWLNQAIEADRQSSEIASELAEVAMAQASYDAAMKALRSLTMMDDPKPITRAMAFLKQAQIAFLRGDARRAQHWARKAKSLDENVTGIDEFLEQLGIE
jgi:tetratricopeptide (TPR) repeat protein